MYCFEILTPETNQHAKLTMSKISSHKPERHSFILAMLKKNRTPAPVSKQIEREEDHDDDDDEEEKEEEEEEEGDEGDDVRHR